MMDDGAISGAVHRPSQHLVEVTAHHAIEQVVQPWSLIASLRPADAFVGELSGDLVAFAFRHGP